jgi:SAM-dependent methyltransferase
VSDIDFGRYSDDYATCRPGPPSWFYERLDHLRPLQGAHCLDLATGPGTVALELAARGSDVVGIDVSPQQVEAAKRLAAHRGFEEAARFFVCRAESTGQPDAGFDLITASQCWHWFDRDAVLEEIRRLLRPSGILAIVSYAYLPQQSAVARDSEELILQFNPSWGMSGESGVFPEQIDDVIDGGLRFVEAFCRDHVEEFSQARWRGRMRTCNGVGSGRLSDEEVQRFDAALEKLLRARYPDPLLVEHRVWCVVARNPVRDSSIL